MFRLKPIEYKTVKQVNASAQRFYEWVKNVDNYSLFLPWCTKSEVLPNSHKAYTDTEGEFKGRLHIGFKAYNFHYDSQIEYKDFSTIISTSQGNSVFDELYSKWSIQDHTYGKWMVNYEVKMTFSNPLYSRFTRYFFDTLVVNINDAFVNAWNIGYEQQLEQAKDEAAKRERSVREFIEQDDLDELDKAFRTSQGSKSDYFKVLKKEQQRERGDFEWKATPRQDRRRTKGKTMFEDELSSKKDGLELKRMVRSQMLIRDLFKNNFLAMQEKERVDKKMQDKQFLNDIYLLDQALGGAPDYKKKIAVHIREIIEK